jgi:hypothetical protein
MRLRSTDISARTIGNETARCDIEAFIARLREAELLV